MEEERDGQEDYTEAPNRVGRKRHSKGVEDGAEEGQHAGEQ